jgi:hypothetical protein
VTTPTVAVTINTEIATGVALGGGTVRFTPTKLDVAGAGSTGAAVVAQSFDVQLDSSGMAVPQIVPNVNNQYQVEFFGSDRNRIGQPVLATIPNQACWLHDHLTTASAVLSDAQRALNGAQAAQAAAQAVLTDAGFVAVKNDLATLNSLAAALTALNALQADLTNLNAVAAALAALNALASDLTNLNALAADQVNLDAVAGALAAINACAAALTAIQNAPTYAAQAQGAAAGAAASDADATAQAQAANGFALSAAAQAAQAYAWSLSAASAQQQDLSAVSRQIHFSPNAILGTLFYDTGKDSNPAWVDQVQNASYASAPLNGTWITNPAGTTNGIATELDARCASATLSAECITAADPGFGSATGWALGTNMTINGGTLNLAATPNAQSASAAGNTAPIVGQVYRITIVIQSLTAGTVRAIWGGTTADFSAPGTYVVHKTATSASASVAVQAIGTTTAVIDSISVKQVTAQNAKTGDYFQLSTDGKHYSLNAGAGVTQTTVGNTSKPPRVWAMVWESGYFCIYDPTKAGCPLWMSFLCTIATTAIGAITSATLIANGVWAKEGKLWIAHSSGLLMADFANDKMLLGRGSFVYTLADRRIAARNSQPAGAWISGVNGIDGWVLGTNTANCITGTVYPDAPVDQNTGLMQPTVFIASASPSTLIKDDGSAAVTTTNMSVNYATLTPWYLLAGAGGQSSELLTVGNLRTVGTNWAVTTLAANANQFTSDLNVGLLACSRSLVAKLLSTPPALSLMRLNASNPLASLFARVTPYSNTGWMVGDIRGCFLSTTVSGTTSAGVNVITDGTFDNPATSALYGNQDGNISHTVSGGLLNVSTNVTAGSTYVYYPAATEPGVQYTVSATFGVVATCTGGWFDVRDGGSGGSGGGPMNTGSGNYNGVTSGVGTITTTFIAVSAITSIRLAVNKTQNDSSCTWDNFTCAPIGLADRSYKANNLTLNGSLTKSAANAATQIMLYGGWSASNYAQQAYSANLDPGTSGVTASIWGTIPANVAAAGTAVDRSAAAGAYYTFGHDATGKLTATVFDGTTTRTVTTGGSYATGYVFKARMILSPSGTLSISVNGAVVVSTTGAPLLTLTNASAVLTTGNRRALDQPWAGGLALVRIGMTIPTPEQSALCYEQEYTMFQPGAVCALADATSLQAFEYDASQQKLKVVSSGYENSLVGLTFSAQAAASAGSLTRCAHQGGMKMLARSTTSPGVDILVPAYGLREELANRDRAAAERAHLTEPFDYSGGFTATETNGSSLLSTVAGWTFPSQANQRGVGATGTNIPANSTLTDYSGATATISAAATGAGSQQIALTGFRLPPGIEAKDVFAGPLGSMSLKTEGVSNDYTRTFDGFCETVLITPGYNARVRINGRRWMQ